MRDITAPASSCNLKHDRRVVGGLLFSAGLFVDFATNDPARQPRRDQEVIDADAAVVLESSGIQIE